MGRVTELQERYYRSPRPATRVMALVIIVALVASGVSFLAWAMLFQSTPKVTSELSSWDIRDDHVVIAYLGVERETQFTEASCRLRAVAADHSVVGEVTVPVTSGPAQQTVEVEIRTERRATSIEKIGCTAPDQPQPR
jgi:hypothetical protein